MMRAIYFHADSRSFAPGEYPDDALPPGHVLLRVRRVGICGSDIHSYESGEMGGRRITSPYILGHEFAGTIEAVAPDVRGGDLAPGVEVAVDPQIPCHGCPLCLRGHENLCPHMTFIGGYPCHGALRERVALPVRNVFPLPEGLSLEEGVMAEPLSVALHAVRLAGAMIDRSAAVIGAGPIGNLVLQCLRQQTGARVLVSDPVEARRALALECGASRAVDPRATDMEEMRRAFDDGLGPDVVFEATRVGEGLRAALELARPGGTVVYIGIADDPVEITTSDPRRKEITLQWVRRSLGCYPTALRLMAQRRIDAARLVTHRGGLDDVGPAVETVAAYRDGVVKSMIEVS